MYQPEDKIEDLKGVGEIAAKKLKAVGIKTIGDLINYFPFRYEDLSKIYPLSEVKELFTRDDPLTGIIPIKKAVIQGQFKNISSFRTRNGKLMTKAIFYDDIDKISILWFNSPFIEQQIKENEQYLITANPSIYKGQVNIVNPRVDKATIDSTNTGRIVPVYFNVPGVYMTTLRKMVKEALDNTKLKDFLKDPNYLDLKQTYTNLHFPNEQNLVNKSQDRVALNELIHVKLHSIKAKEIHNSLHTNFSIKKSYFDNFITKLPYLLTDDQNKSCQQIIEGLKQKTPLNILLSGDVGSGKTIVSIAAVFDVVKNGGKVAYLAPTVVLAEQVYKEYCKYFANNEVTLVTSKTSKLFKTKTKLSNILIGTHALLNIDGLSDHTNFVIIDEQHKFGVKQRAMLVESLNKKGPPHVLTMTATPIPRSMALAFFEELSVCRIKTKPQGRLPITTKVLSEAKKNDCYKWLKKDVIDKTKTYYIVPFIKKSIAENFTDVKNIEEMEPKLKKYFGEKNVYILHGKMKDDEKTDLLNKFRKVKGGILLSTQVVEVGVDIKEATVIIIESAERFGLASLHQLRGRVGRNDLQSYCFLIASTENKNESMRLKNLEKENDGFKLAELDLKTRGSGEIFGIRQSGEIDLKFVDFSNKKVLEDASKQAKSIFLNEDLLKQYKQNYFTREFFYIKDN